MFEKKLSVYTRLSAVDYYGNRASYSQYGSNLDLVAPGGTDVDFTGDTYPEAILQQTFNPNTKNPIDFGYWFFTGTSMAAPHVSGLAALLMAQGRTSAQTVDALIKTTTDKGTTGRDNLYGYGLINAQAALTLSFDPINLPPVANAGPDQTATEGNSVTFDASGSYDSDVTGTITSYYWDFGDGFSATDKITAHTYTDPGIYTATLTVTDNKGATGSDTATVIVQGINADFSLTTNPTSLSIKQGRSGTTTITVNKINNYFGSPLLSATGMPKGMTITFSKNPVPAGSSATMTATAARTTPIGTYTMSIIGTDAAALSHTTTVKVTVTR